MARPGRRKVKGQVPTDREKVTQKTIQFSHLKKNDLKVLDKALQHLSITTKSTALNQTIKILCNEVGLNMKDQIDDLWEESSEEMTFNLESIALSMHGKAMSILVDQQAQPQSQEETCTILEKATGLALGHTIQLLKAKPSSGARYFRKNSSGKFVGKRCPCTTWVFGLIIEDDAGCYRVLKTEEFSFKLSGKLPRSASRKLQDIVTLLVCWIMCPVKKIRTIFDV
ncbi:hypothetical protein CPB84DRAFT_1748173 [Gymnopilus junonius]|uniref:Uncharacterized protein n=1 Tax=Gymnopilus junonius TaxID=109634 RepID=A0A9P5NLM5_GYMJU|nr:hypothetical protein CPB84DRAFT_1748173 [Gymnopilus junonius]